MHVLPLSMGTRSGTVYQSVQLLLDLECSVHCSGAAGPDTKGHLICSHPNWFEFSVGLQGAENVECNTKGHNFITRAGLTCGGLR